MRNFYSIGEISELLGIPKSTLRYWESEGLIEKQRDDMNNYRKYYPSSVFTISDLAHFRCLRMSLQDMKKLPQQSPDALEESLISLDHDLDKKLLELNTAKDYINKKMEHIKEYHKLSLNQYQQEAPDYDYIFLFSIDDTEAWSVYIKDQYQSILLYNPESGSLETGLVVPTHENHPKLWEKDHSRQYLSFVLKVAYSNPSEEDFRPHLDYFHTQGYEISNILARYLFSACDDGRYYDYYKAFAEVTQ
jgi:DNA-binding transcriptional MerR regulator